MKKNIISLQIFLQNGEQSITFAGDSLQYLRLQNKHGEFVINKEYDCSFNFFDDPENDEFTVSAFERLFCGQDIHSVLIEYEDSYSKIDNVSAVVSYDNTNNLFITF